MGAGWLKNQPWNVKSLEQETHRRIHSRFKGKERFNPAQQYWYGSPEWAKAGKGSVAGHMALGRSRREDED